MYNIKYFILLLPVAVALIWFVIISFSAFKDNRRKLALSFFMLSVAMSLLPGFLFFVGDYELYEKLYVFTVFFALSQFPAFYNYIVSLTSEKSNSIIFYLKHWILPLGLTSVAFFVKYNIMSGSERLYFVEHVLTGEVDLSGKFELAFIADKTFKVMFVISAFYYFHLINKRINNHEEQILDYFSNTDELSFKWFKIFKATFFFAFISGVFFHSFDRSFHIQNLWMSLVAFSLLAVFYWVVGFFGNKQVDIYASKYEKSIINNALLQVSENEIVLDDNKAKEILKVIDAIIKNKKLYLKEDLTLIDLAIITRTDRNKLSYVIKNYLHLNFVDYINQKRIKYAKDILSSDDIISKDVLYKQCGFKNQSKFCKIFKEYTGDTPTKYRNRILLTQRAS